MFTAFDSQLQNEEQAGSSFSVMAVDAVTSVHGSCLICLMTSVALIITVTDGRARVKVPHV
jgi:hypothetical protein